MSRKGKSRNSAPKPIEKPKSPSSNGVLGGLLKKVGVSPDEKLISKLNEEEKQALADLTTELEKLIKANELTKQEQEDIQTKIELNVEQAAKDTKEVLSSVSCAGVGAKQHKIVQFSLLPKSIVMFMRRMAAFFFKGLPG